MSFGKTIFSTVMTGLGIMKEVFGAGVGGVGYLHGRANEIPYIGVLPKVLSDTMGFVGERYGRGMKTARSQVRCSKVLDAIKALGATRESPLEREEIIQIARDGGLNIAEITAILEQVEIDLHEGHAHLPEDPDLDFPSGHEPAPSTP